MTEADLHACLARLDERVDGVRERLDQMARAQDAALLELREWRRDHDAAREAMVRRLEDGFVTTGQCILLRQDHVTRGQLTKLGAWVVGLAVSTSMLATGVASFLIVWLRSP